MAISIILLLLILPNYEDNFDTDNEYEIFLSGTSMNYGLHWGGYSLDRNSEVMAGVQGSGEVFWIRDIVTSRTRWTWDDLEVFLQGHSWIIILYHSI